MQLVSATHAQHRLDAPPPPTNAASSLFSTSSSLRRILIPANSRLVFVSKVLIACFGLERELEGKAVKFKALRRITKHCLDERNNHRAEPDDDDADGGKCINNQLDSVVSVIYKPLLHPEETATSSLVSSKYAPGCFIRHSHPHEPVVVLSQCGEDYLNLERAYSHFEHVRDIHLFSINQVLSAQQQQLLDTLTLTILDFQKGVQHDFQVKLIQSIPINSSHIEKIPLCTGGTLTTTTQLPSAAISDINKNLKRISQLNSEGTVTHNNTDSNALTCSSSTSSSSLLSSLSSSRMHVDRWFEGKELQVVETANMELWRVKSDWLIGIRNDFLKKASSFHHHRHRHHCFGNTKGVGSGNGGHGGCGWREPDGKPCVKCFHGNPQLYQVQMEDLDESSGSDCDDSLLMDYGCFLQRV
ncbi:hypothetical protein BDR26DRAFT_1008807 [Obelidium mucronatum]|nr:hypothetical protein BDR26DRAFT_1008807 [Obelidium mucronatum]